MGQSVHKVATYDDLCDLPDNVIGELLLGQLYASPRPAAPHALASSALGIDLGGPFMRGRGGPGGWWIIFEPELHFGQDVLVPDLAGWRRERMPTFPTGAFFTLAPDWVCEILSPSTAHIDRGRKLAIYGREGVKNVWLLDPILKTLEVFRLEGESWVLVEVYIHNAVVRAEPFAAVELELVGVWGQAEDANDTQG